MPEPGTRPREAGTRAILDALLDGDPAQSLDFDDLLDGLGRRAFGMCDRGLDVGVVTDWVNRA